MLITRRGFSAAGLLLLALPNIVRAATLPPYAATAGMLRIGLSGETADAEIFHVDYLAKDADPAERPVTFVFNGGPGRRASIFTSPPSAPRSSPPPATAASRQRRRA
jgi:hypothetical protein